MKKDLSKHYDGLGAHERFQLALKSRARGDETEADRLDRSCPRKTYMMVDAEYLDRYETLQRLTGGFIAQTEQAKGKLTIHHVLEFALTHVANMARDEITSAYYCGFTEADDKKELPEKLGESVEEGADQLIKFTEKIVLSAKEAIMTQVKADFDAFEAFCRERIGLDVETVVAAYGGAEALRWIDHQELARAEGVDCAELTQMYVDCWDQEVGE